MTPVLLQTLKFIARFYKKNKYMPSITELGDEFNISAVSAWSRLKRLEHFGHIKTSNQKRSIEIISNLI